jgi:hypothetical protein
LAAPSTTAQTAISQLKSQSSTSTRIKPTLNWPQTLDLLAEEGFNVSISRIGFRAEAWILLQDVYLPKPSPLNNVDIGETNHYSWTQTACSLKGPSNALDYSLAGLCAIQVQIAETGITKTDIGHSLYIHGLQELVKELAVERETVTDEALAAIVVLSTCEVRSSLCNHLMTKIAFRDSPST